MGVHGRIRRNAETAERQCTKMPRRETRHEKLETYNCTKFFLKRIKSQIISSQNIYVTQLIEMISSLGLAAAVVAVYLSKQSSAHVVEFVTEEQD